MCREPSDKDHDGARFIRIGYMQAYETANPGKYMYYAKTDTLSWGGSIKELAGKLKMDYELIREGFAVGQIDTPSGVMKLWSETY